MAKLEHYTTKFETECFYHVYNRSINKEILFKSDENFKYFLRRYYHFLGQFVDTYCYCLLGNHFHFLVRIKPLPILQGLAEADVEFNSVHNMISHQFRKLFQSYALAFNKQHNRYGTLFQKPFKRAKVDSDSYLSSLISYIHLNPEKHGLVRDFTKWPWSSYHSIISTKETHLARKAVFNWFGGKEQFVVFHRQNEEGLVDRLKIDNN